jgi:hypothetical protein
MPHRRHHGQAGAKILTEKPVRRGFEFGAALYIDINRYTLIDWINAGTLRASKIGNANKIDRLLP